MKAAPCVRPTGGQDAVLSHTAFGRCPSGFSTPLRMIYDHELIIYRNCTCCLEFEDREFICTPNTFIIIPPGKWHSERCLRSRAGDRYWCHFDWQFQNLQPDSPVMSFAQNRPSYELCHPAPDFVPHEIQHGKIPVPSKTYKLARKLQSLTSTGLPHEMLLAGPALHELLIQLLDVPEQASDPAPPGDTGYSLASRVRQILDVVASRPPENLMMSKALSQFNYSYEHLCRVFKKAYGVSPLRYVHAQQITRAKALLKNSELNVAEICFVIGMNSPAYFTKIFRKMIGKTPSEYRSGFRS